MKESEGVRDTNEYKFGYGEGFTDGFTKAMEVANAISLSGEQRLLLARESLDYLPFPRIIELLCYQSPINSPFSEVTSY